MKITNAYQAILAKLGGNKDVNIPAPRNKYEKLLNDISENGGSSGGGGVLNIRAIDDTNHYQLTLDKTWKEIYDAMHAGMLCHVYVTDFTDYARVDDYLVSQCWDSHGWLLVDAYNVSVNGETGTIQVKAFGADSENDYPVYYYGN